MSLLHSEINIYHRRLEPFPIYKMAFKMAAKMLAQLYRQVDIPLHLNPPKNMTKGL